MEDREIVDLYFARSETAIAESDRKYGSYCRYIAERIVGNIGDAEECVNDTWLSAWGAMPPARPARLSTFLGKITRNISINRREYNSREKRGAYAIALDELSECISDEGAGEVSDSLTIREALNSFLSSLKPQERIVFVKRYWYVESVAEIARETDLTVSNVKITLHRLRKKLKEKLETEGIIL